MDWEPGVGLTWIPRSAPEPRNGDTLTRQVEPRMRLLGIALRAPGVSLTMDRTGADVFSGCRF